MILAVPYVFKDIDTAKVLSTKAHRIARPTPSAVDQQWA